MAIILYFIIPLFLIIIALLLYAKDPPLDLIAHLNSETAYQHLLFIAKQNSKEARDLSFE